MKALPALAALTPSAYPEYSAFVGSRMPLPRVGFHASHEQFSPRELMKLAQRAEQAKFDVASCFAEPLKVMTSLTVGARRISVMPTTTSTQK